jgi:hypothetical protein
LPFPPRPPLSSYPLIGHDRYHSCRFVETASSNCYQAGLRFVRGKGIGGGREWTLESNG